MFNDIGERRTRSLGARPNLTLHTETFISNNKCIVGGATRYAPGRTLLRPVATRDRETCVVYPRERGTAVRVAVAGSIATAMLTGSRQQTVTKERVVVLGEA